MQFLIIKKPRENFIETMSEWEAGIMSEHFLYMKQKLAEGKVILAGPVTTGEFGLSILETETEEEARDITNNDPAVRSGIMKPTMYPYRVSLLKGRD
ncbi:MAG TPA: YciI family protein [Ignavibacteria bacterium]|nr:YciI family protein [Ignavibacteria bacterium]